jgi:hypothetical protein
VHPFEVVQRLEAFALQIDSGLLRHDAEVVAGGEVLAVCLEHDDPDVVIVRRRRPGPVEFLQERRMLRVALLGPVQRDDCHVGVDFVLDEFHGCALSRG